MGELTEEIGGETKIHLLNCGVTMQKQMKIIYIFEVIQLSCTSQLSGFYIFILESKFPKILN